MYKGAPWRLAAADCTTFFFCAKEHGMDTKGVEIRVIGDLALPPPAVQGSAARLMQQSATLTHKQAVVNICFCYT